MIGKIWHRKLKEEIYINFSDILEPIKEVYYENKTVKIVCNIVLTSITAVSYTHLDVYKRQ